MRAAEDGCACDNCATLREGARTCAVCSAPALVEEVTCAVHRGPAAMISTLSAADAPAWRSRPHAACMGLAWLAQVLTPADLDRVYAIVEAELWRVAP